MVAKEVELITRSARPDESAVRWVCDGSPAFKLESHERQEPGTDVILHLMDEELEYLEPARIRTLITQYCDFMPVDVQLEGESVNKRDPAWRKTPRDMTDQDSSICTDTCIPSRVIRCSGCTSIRTTPTPFMGSSISLRLLVVPTGKRVTSACTQPGVCQRLNQRDRPRYLLPLRGVIDSPDIPLNVSRSALQTDQSALHRQLCRQESC